MIIRYATQGGFDQDLSARLPGHLLDADREGCVTGCWCAKRGWSSHKYQDWLADTLVQSLLTTGRANAVRSRAAKRALPTGT